MRGRNETGSWACADVDVSVWGLGLRATEVRHTSGVAAVPSVRSGHVCMDGTCRDAESKKKAKELLAAEESLRQMMVDATEAPSPARPAAMVVD